MCAKCARRVYFYCGFIMFLDGKPFWGLRATQLRLCLLFLRGVMLFVLFCGAQIELALGFYKEILNCLERFGEISYVFAGRNYDDFSMSL